MKKFVRMPTRHGDVYVQAEHVSCIGPDGDGHTTINFTNGNLLWPTCSIEQAVEAIEAA